MKSNKLSTKQIAKLHVAKKQLGLSEDEYRAILSRFGVSSSKELKQRQWVAVESYLYKIGFKPMINRKQTQDRRANYINKITAILLDCKLTTNYADGIAKQMFGKEIINCNTNEVKAVMIALITYQKKMVG